MTFEVTIESWQPPRSRQQPWRARVFDDTGFLNLVFFGIYVIIFVRTVQGQFSLGEMVLLIQLILQNPRRGRVRRRRLLSCTPLALLPQPCPCARSISLNKIRLQRNPGKRKLLLNL